MKAFWENIIHSAWFGSTGVKLYISRILLPFEWTQLTCLERKPRAQIDGIYLTY